MGACASKPKDLDTQEAPIPEAPLSPKKTDTPAAPEAHEPEDLACRYITQLVENEAIITFLPAGAGNFSSPYLHQQENEDGEETKKEEPLVDLTEPAQEAPKAEEATVETETPKAEVILGETPSTAVVVEKVVTEEDNKATKVSDEDKKKVEVAAVADEVVVASPVVATVSEVKTETPVAA